VPQRGPEGSKDHILKIMTVNCSIPADSLCNEEY
jgi:hypothetical protein